MGSTTTRGVRIVLGASGEPQTEVTARRDDARMSDAQVRRVVAVALQAPTADNCQPWRFRWDGTELAIALDEERARHTLDVGRSATLLAFGALAEALEGAAAAEGFDTRIAPHLDGARWATATFAPNGQACGGTSPADVWARASDRRLYRGGEIADPVFADVRRLAARAPALRYHVIDRFSDELVRFLLRVDGFPAYHEPVFRDVLRWVRWSDEEVAATRDGVSWRTAGVELPSMSRRLLGEPRAWSLMHRPIALAGRAWLRLQLRSSAALLCITGPAGASHLVEAGRVGMAIWSRLCRAGWGVQPLTLAALLTYDRATVGLPAATRPEYHSLFDQGRGVLARAFGYRDHDGELPLWLFRTGRSAPLPPRLRALRLPLERVLTFAQS